MSLRVWLPLDGNLENKGISNITVTNNGATVDTSGKIGSCYSFDGSSYLSFNKQIFDTNAFSVSFWIKANNISGNKGVINCRNASNKSFAIYLIGAQIRIDTGSNWSTGYSLTASTWTHVTFTTDGVTERLYVNGIQSKNRNYTSVINTITNFCTIGCEHTNGSNLGVYFNGYLNDIRMYNHCLSAAEVHEISLGLVLHYKLDDTYAEASTFLTSTITTTAYNSQGGKYGYNADSNLAKTEGIFQGKLCIKISTITEGKSALPYSYFSNLYTSNGTNSPAYKALSFDYYTTCPTTTWLNIYKLGNGTGTATWKTTSATAGTRTGTYTNSSNSILVLPNEWNRVEVVFHGTADADAQWGYCINGPAHTSNANYYFLFANILLELNDHVTGQGQGMHLAIITDSSGYGHNGTIVGDLILNSETKRYSTSIKWNSSDPTASNETGICYIQTPITLTTPLQMSITWWAKPENGYGGGTGLAALCTSNNTSRPTDYNTTAFHHRDSGFDIYPSDASGGKRLSFTYTQNEWHHYALTYDGTTARSYLDGVEKSTVTVGTNKTLATFSLLYIGYSQAGGVKRKTLGSYSDFRMYCTALSADDIKQLYQVGAKVDNLLNIHTFEFIEGNTPTKITKLGQLKTLVVQEAINQSLAYDKTLYTEPDSSTWIHIFHHNNPAGSRFTDSANDWSNGIYIDADKWYNVEPFLNDTLPYEFMIKLKTTSNATETKYRWIQTPNPLTATWTDVKPGTVTFITTTGYSNNSMGGMYLMKSSNLHMCIANGSNGNWFGGIGASSSYNGGIPGYPNTTVTSGYIDLYLRIYPTAKIIKNIGVGSNSLIEK